MSKQSKPVGGRQTGTESNREIRLQNILVPVDFSAASVHGLAFAGAIARRFESQLDLVHVVEPPVLPEWGYAHLAIRDAQLVRESKRRLPKLPTECGLPPAMIRSASIVKGEAEYRVCETAVEKESDLIVIASHGLGGLPQALFGSIAERVVRRAPCPVLAVRDRALKKRGPDSVPSFDPRQIIVATDFSEASRTAFPYATAFAREFGAQLVLAYVFPSHIPAELGFIGRVLDEKKCMAEARKHMPQFLKTQFHRDLGVEALILDGGPAHELCRLAEERDADLIIMATHGHTGLKHFMLGSVAESVVRHAPCPVLVVRPTEHGIVKG